MNKKIIILEKEIYRKKSELESLKRKKKKEKNKVTIKSAMHSIFRKGPYPRYHFETVCGYRLIIDKGVIKNASYYESSVTCPKCKINMRPYGGKCRKCGVEFDNCKETECSNCGSITKRRKIKTLN